MRAPRQKTPDVQSRRYRAIRWAIFMGEMVAYFVAARIAEPAIPLIIAVRLRMWLWEHDARERRRRDRE